MFVAKCLAIYFLVYIYYPNHMLLTIKNMVCDRCISVVEQQLQHHGLTVEEIALGEVLVSPDPSEEKLTEISAALKVLGFELIDRDKDKLVERIRNTIIETIHHSSEPEMHVVFSEVLSSRLNRDYSYLSRLFSESEDTTIEKFIIQQKIEKVKELLQYGELNLNEIAWQMGYSSSAHLSNQFKSVAGISPREFRSLEVNNRKPLDSI
jgi:AraC family transcriptional regulator